MKRINVMLLQRFKGCQNLRVTPEKSLLKKKRHLLIYVNNRKEVDGYINRSATSRSEQYFL